MSKQGTTQTIRRIGKIDYVVGVKHNPNSRETLGAKIEKLIKREIKEVGNNLQK